MLHFYQSDVGRPHQQDPVPVHHFVFVFAFWKTVEGWKAFLFLDMGAKLFPLLKMALLWKRLPSTQSEHLTEATGENDKQGVASSKPYFWSNESNLMVSNTTRRKLSPAYCCYFFTAEHCLCWWWRSLAHYVTVTFLGPKMGFWPLGLGGPPS